MGPEKLGHRGHDDAFGLGDAKPVEARAGFGLDHVRTPVRTDGGNTDVEAIRARQDLADLALGLDRTAGDVEEADSRAGRDFKYVLDLGARRAAADRSPVERELPRTEAKLGNR